MTLQQAQNLKTGQVIHNISVMMADKVTPVRAKVTSVKTWRTRPDEVIVGLKRGMYDFFKMGVSTYKIIDTHYSEWNLS